MNGTDLLLTMLCSDIMSATKNAVPNKAPNASEPRQAHPIRGVLIESYDDYTESWLVYLNDAVIMRHARHLPVNDVITPKDSVDVFLRYWCPGYPDSGRIGRQRCNARSDWGNCKSDKERITLHKHLLYIETPPLGRFDRQSLVRFKVILKCRCGTPLQFVLSQLCALFQTFIRVTFKTIEKNHDITDTPAWRKEGMSALSPYSAGNWVLWLRKLILTNNPFVAQKLSWISKGNS